MEAAVEPSIFDRDLIWLDAPAPSSKEDLFKDIAARLSRNGRINSESEFIAALHHREDLGSTYMGNGVAIPHAKSDAVLAPTVTVYRFIEPMRYESGGEIGGVSRVFVLAMPDGADREHLRTLASVAQMLADDDLLDDFDEAISSEQAEAVLRGHSASRIAQS